MKQFVIKVEHSGVKLSCSSSRNSSSFSEIFPLESLTVMGLVSLTEIEAKVSIYRHGKQKPIN